MDGGSADEGASVGDPHRTQMRFPEKHPRAPARRNCRRCDRGGYLARNGLGAAEQEPVIHDCGQELVKQNR
jgi:hypothetical protein